VLHPIHRARAWQRRLDSERGLNRVTLAKGEGIAPGSVTHYLKLLDLDDQIQTKLLELTTAAEVRRYSLNRMKALADLPGPEQRRRFAAL
jgi:ParB-like chromosome segregation protein Spo0J